MQSLLVLLALAALGAAYEPVQLYYHESVGIAEAARIKQQEQALDFDGGRIVGGEPAALGAYPFLVGLVITLTTGGTSVCGSSMLSNTRAITAGHCWWDGRNQARSFTLVFGSTRLFSGGTRVRSDSVELHSGYNPSALSNDVAMISFQHVGYTSAVGRVRLPAGGGSLVGSWVQAAGYGKTADNAAISAGQVQSHVTLQVISNAACARVYGAMVLPSTLCTAGDAGRSTCGGDSGGPLVTRAGQPAGAVLVGVTSFGSVRGCEARWPAGFARVSSFLGWIQARL